MCQHQNFENMKETSRVERKSRLMPTARGVLNRLLIRNTRVDSEETRVLFCTGLFPGRPPIAKIMTYNWCGYPTAWRSVLLPRVRLTFRTNHATGLLSCGDQTRKRVLNTTQPLPRSDGMICLLALFSIVYYLYLTLTEGFPCFFLSCKANAMV
jgi:hypothetical protein